MKICIAHNRYQQAGGEDRVVLAEAEMLRRSGHQVEVLETGNDDIQGTARKASAAVSAFFSLDGYHRVRRVLAEFRPEVLHVHNFMPTLSPAVFFAASATDTPVVQTLHNYRLLCANAELFHDGAVCERCVESGSFLPGVVRGCYRGSRAGSAIVGGSMAFHQVIGTWDRQVQRYIALTEFAAEKLGGQRVPRQRIRVKPNFVPDRGAGQGGGGFALFAGRLSPEKGLDTLLSADTTGNLALPVYIAGDGPLREQVIDACSRPESKLRYLGMQGADDLGKLMKQADVLLLPSLWFEGFPMVVAEALASGTPVIASRIGGLPEIIQDGVTGFLYEPGSAGELTRTLQRFAGLSQEQGRTMRRAARQSYLQNYNEATNLDRLMRIYGEAIEDVRDRCN